MSDKPNWEEIRRAFEGGLTNFRLLEEKYDVPKSTIERHAKAGQWDGTVGRDNKKNGTERDGGTDQQKVRSVHVLRSELPSIPSAVDGANLGIEALVVYLRENSKKMDLSDHVKAATALSQYNRIIVNAIPEEGEEDGTNIIAIDTRDLSTERLAKLKAFALEMKESEQEENKQVG